MNLLALALLLSPQLPPSSAPRQESAGADSELVVLWSAGIDALLVDGRDKGLATALGMLDERLAELGRDLDDSTFPTEAVQLAHALLTGPACLRIERGDGRRAGSPPVRFQLTCRARDAAAAKRNVEQFAALAMRAGIPLQKGGGGAQFSAPTPFGPIVLATQADALVLALGEPRKEDFACATGLPQGVAPALHARWNGRGIGELVAPMVMADGPDALQFWRMLELLGVVGESAPVRTWSLGIAADHALVRSVVSGWAAAGDGSLNVPPLDKSDFARIPADATFARLFQLRPRMLLSLAETLEPGAGERAGTALRQFLGADLGELLDLFGPTAGAFGSFSTGGGGLASGVAFIEVTDAARVEALLERLAGHVDSLSRGPARGRVGMRTWDHEGTHARTLVFPGLPVPLELSFAVHDGALWVALRPNALVATLAKSDGRSVLDHTRLAPLVADRPADAVSFGFVDAPLWLDRGYGTASALSAALANALRSPYAPAREPGSIVPSFAALRRGARPTVSWSRVAGGDLVGTTTFDRSFVANATVALGTPISSMYGSVAGLGIVSSIAIPRLFSARLAANESAAIATLRNLCSAQAQLSAQATLDADGDGLGEYGFLGELAGARDLRGLGERLEPPVLSSAFGVLEDDGNGDGVVQRSGYWFQVWLPGRSGGAVAEPVSPEAAVEVHADNAEIAWCAYAWPVEPGATGNRVFFVNQEGDMLVFDNTEPTFGGLAHAGGRSPSFASAFTRPDLEAATAVGKRSTDGTVWRTLE